MWRDIQASREVAWRLAVRDISAQYRAAFLGMLWALLLPLSTTAAFTFLNAQRIVVIDDVGVAYPVYVFVGTTFWTLCVDALNAILSDVKSAGGVLSRVVFPREALIFAAIIKVLFHFAIRVVVLIVVLLIYQAPLLWTVLLIPFAIVGLVLLGTVIGLLLVPLALLVEDLSRAANLVAISLWFYLTPVVYPPPTTGLLATLTTWNPVAPLVVTAREALLTGNFTYLPAFWLIFVMALALFIAGMIVYRVSLPIVIERMGA
jgi:lipopolysaccharide transport system permease protein